MQKSDLSRIEYSEYDSYYIGLAPNGELLIELNKSILFVRDFFNALPEEKHTYRYAPDKWSPKDILQHMIDVERVFSYRALRFARNDKWLLPGFEVEDYGSAANGDNRKLSSLIREFEFARKSTQALFSSFDDEMLERIGTASKLQLSVRAIGYKLIGHDLHHIGIIKERYL